MWVILYFIIYIYKVNSKNKFIDFLNLFNANDYINEY